MRLSRLQDTARRRRDKVGAWVQYPPTRATQGVTSNRRLGFRLRIRVRPSKPYEHAVSLSEKMLGVSRNAAAGSPTRRLAWRHRGFVKLSNPGRLNIPGEAKVRTRLPN